MIGHSTDVGSKGLQGGHNYSTRDWHVMVCSYQEATLQIIYQAQDSTVCHHDGTEAILWMLNYSCGHNVNAIIEKQAILWISNSEATL